MKELEVLNEYVSLDIVERMKATHFAFCYRSKVLYLIDLEFGYKLINKSAVAYSFRKLVFLAFLKLVPFWLFKVIKMGCYVKADLDSRIQEEVESLDGDYWNLFVGSYDAKQKMVFQVYNRENKTTSYIKVGVASSDREMLSEIDFFDK